MKSKLCTAISILLSAIPATMMQAQQGSFEVPPTNSHATVQQRVAATDIKVEYNRPNMKGRKIFGGLVPFEKIWRTGSDASTKINFSTPVSLNGHALDSGSYELFTIPGKKEWTIILQPNKSQWGSYSYKPDRDVLRFTTQPQSLSQPVETFTVGFDKITSQSAELTLSWEKTRVPILVTIDLAKTVIPKIEASLLNDEKKPYFRAAMFYFENDLDINRAAELMGLAVKENPNHLGMLYRQALILEKKGDRKEAIEASEKSLKLSETAGEELKAEYIKLNTALLDRLRR
ncbi:MAG TPA: DUF2911 domain-containing protein [Chitinophagaceae bacterium]|nr:DUF2911 domain-containing protein [Chitinophagaceae bacterium]